MSRFLAEDFRNLINAIDSITEDKPHKSEELINPDDLLITNRQHNIAKTSINSIQDLINYLDQFSELNQYRDINAQFDDAFYDSIPLETLLNVADLSPSELEQINTEPEKGNISIDNGNVSVFGGDSTV